MVINAVLLGLSAFRLANPAKFFDLKITKCQA